VATPAAACRLALLWLLRLERAVALGASQPAVLPIARRVGMCVSPVP